ncbi:MAG: GNAT family N-acetyltransferase [Candidatus Cloacimonetes bacterium]|nr:GNAT family N-acetyltransferase [Candidatus Cloacimonadota bacterium]
MIRNIKPEDKPRVLEIAAKIWEGDDYIPEVFDEWVKDQNGIFSGLWEDDKLVGFGRLYYLTPTDIWLEGLRKDPDINIKGVGEKFARYYFQKLKGKKINSIRFSTYFDNIASKKLNEKLGFKKILTLSLKTLEIKKKTRSGIPENLTTNFEFDELQNYIRNSNYLELSKNFIGKGWVVYPYSVELLTQFVNENKVIVWLNNKTIKGAAFYSDVSYENIFWISFIDAENDRVYEELLNYLMNLVIEQDKKYIEILVPQDRLLLSFFESKDFKSWEQNNDFYLYELPEHLIKKITFQ